jgi:hypothetical protein
MGALGLCALSGAANASSLTQPGETVGVAIGAPLPEGVYFLDTFSYGSFRGLGNDGDLSVNIPVLAWSTPWTLFGGRIEAYGAVPEVAGGRNAYGVNSGLYLRSMYNPALLVGAAWNLGGGFSFSNFVGGYAPVNTVLGAGNNSWIFNERFALTYLANGWNLTAHGIVGIAGNTQTSGFVSGYQQRQADYFNLDLTAVKTIGKWEVGAVGFYSTDLSRPYVGYGPLQAQFALGGLVGYNFGGITVQAYLTRDVYSHGYYNLTASGLGTGSTAYETRLWTRVIVPLWNPEAPKAVAAKY